MKYRVTALLALAAVVAVPSLALAATTSDADVFMPATSVTDFPPVIVARNHSATAPLFNAERTYLSNACPAVSQHPGSYSSVLSRFCSEYQG